MYAEIRPVPAPIYLGVGIFVLYMYFASKVAP
jgi:hypothetical protein